MDTAHALVWTQLRRLPVRSSERLARFLGLSSLTYKSDQQYLPGWLCLRVISVRMRVTPSMPLRLEHMPENTAADSRPMRTDVRKTLSTQATSGWSWLSRSPVQRSRHSNQGSFQTPNHGVPAMATYVLRRESQGCPEI